MRQDGDRFQQMQQNMRRKSAESQWATRHARKTRMEVLFIARLKQILIVCRERPVVVLTRAIDVPKGLLVPGRQGREEKSLSFLHG